MAGLPDAKIDIVRTLVRDAPDKVVDGLRNALALVDGDTALAGVRRVVDAEVDDRNLRNRVLEPVAPLFVGDGAAPAKTPGHLAEPGAGGFAKAAAQRVLRPVLPARRLSTATRVSTSSQVL